MVIDNIALYVLTCTLAAGTPGPGTIAVLNSASLNGFKKTLPLMLGIVFGMGFVGILSSFGVNAAASYSDDLFSLLRGLGGVYIGYIAILCFKSAFNSKSGSSSTSNKNVNYSFLTGTMVVSLSPKTFMFFSALLPTFLIPGNAVEWQFIMLTAILLLCTFSVHLVYASFCSASKNFLQSKSFYIELISGITFLFFAFTAIFSGVN
ncbi:LysE family translocator [Photobacterium sagamiensis]|uniref:LysE family translocator n=1 Tax=Photobacterium sagamiensis TaxID=2910241 RepID=UPI003D0CAA1C